MGPAPVSPATPGPSRATVSIGKGKPTPGPSAAAHSVGKPGRTQHLGTVVGKPGKGLNSLGGGDLAAHAVNNYSKLPGSVVPVLAHKGAQMIKGSAGGIRNHVRQGGLGPGKMSTPGPSNTDYSMNSGDTE
jgi:hypothetical protein